MVASLISSGSDGLPVPSAPPFKADSVPLLILQKQHPVDRGQCCNHYLPIFGGKKWRFSFKKI
jgi:hypothetical protein